ncbi:MAG: SPOR domain-containing protein [Treponema sp.]|nr:SPOR domain-containing protein [Treponema sp.]
MKLNNAGYGITAVLIAAIITLSGFQPVYAQSASPAADNQSYFPDPEWADDSEIVDLPDYTPPAASQPVNGVGVPAAPPTVQAPPAAQAPAVPVTAPAAPLVTINEKDIIPGIPPLEPAPVASRPENVTIDESLFIRSFEQADADASLASAQAPETREPDSKASVSQNVISGDTAPAPAAPEFSAPLINSIQQGKFYVQLGAYTDTDLVQQEISRIGQSYPVVILNTASTGTQVYRILVGPLTQGESAAVLQRFKSTGYTDAFIRRN